MLPFSYNEDRVFLYPIDPTVAFGYWDFTEATWERVKTNPHWPLVLLLMSDDHVIRRVETSKEAKNFYFRGTPPDTDLQLVLAIHENGHDSVILRSPHVLTPPYSPSPRMDVEFSRLNIHEHLPVPSWKESLRRREAKQHNPQQGDVQPPRPWEPVPDWHATPKREQSTPQQNQDGYSVPRHDADEDSLPDYMPPSGQAPFQAVQADLSLAHQGQLPVPRPAWFSGLSNLFPQAQDNRAPWMPSNKESLGGVSSGLLANASSTLLQQASSHVLTKGEGK